jgi:hypothetical protein
MIGSIQSTRKSRLIQANQKDWQTACPRNYENREETVVYQHDGATIFRGKHTIFELTDMLETASCRAYPEKRSGL